MYMYICTYIYVYLNKTDTLFLLILSLICLSLCMSVLMSGWSEFWKVSYFSLVILAPTEVIFGGMNNEMTMSHILLY